jgi:hypothetical protein
MGASGTIILDARMPFIHEQESSSGEIKLIQTFNATK